MSHPNVLQEGHGPECPHCGHEAYVIAWNSYRYAAKCDTCGLTFNEAIDRDCEVTHSDPYRAYTQHGEEV